MMQPTISLESLSFKWTHQVTGANYIWCWFYWSRCDSSKKSNDVISGLTTSAMIWGAAGLGVATGAGFYKEAFLSLFFILISVEFLPWLFQRIGPIRLQEKRNPHQNVSF
ncbi:hypothetical protein BsIDN1_12660 [Bacillus safensis]|uniref:MgtC/SapB/SrpB/YhiD N-terminal domain-containing protein n=1 Tax=Bacillus safensis TaxID=561879 RepID=A0A5S9M4E1_BACIA|nr:hypothetical protein BsIDN1_12660 [Bacillus safensis]